MARVLITGAGGLLGGYLVEAASRRGLEVVAWNGRADVDVADAHALGLAFIAVKPKHVIHAAAMARVDDCQRLPDVARGVNADAPAQLARLCRRWKARMVHVSTDMVFSGEEAPYAIHAPTRPLSHYGATKAEGEAGVLASGGTVARVALLAGPSRSGKPSFFGSQVEALREGRPVQLFEDEWRTPIDLPSAAEGLVELALARAGGVWHLGGPERLSRLEMGRILARAIGADEGLCVAARRPADRPPDLSLDSSAWRSGFPHLAWPTFAEAAGGHVATA